MTIFSFFSKTPSNQPSPSSASLILENILQESQTNRCHRQKWLRQFWQETWDVFLRCEYGEPNHSLYHSQHLIRGNDKKRIDHDDVEDVVDPGEVCLIRHPTCRHLCDRHFDNKRIESDIGLDNFIRAVAVRTHFSPEKHDALVRDCMMILNGREVAWHCSQFCTLCKLGLKQTARVQVTTFPLRVRLDSNCRHHQLIELSINQDNSMERLEQLLGQYRLHPGSTNQVDAALDRLNLDAYEYYRLGIESLPLSCWLPYCSFPIELSFCVDHESILTYVVVHTEIYHQHEISLDQLRSFLYQHRRTCPLYDHIFNEKSLRKHPIRNLILVMNTLQLAKDTCLLWWKYWLEVHRLNICNNPSAIDPVQIDSIAFMSEKIFNLQNLCKILHERGVSEPQGFLSGLPIDLLLARTSRRNSQSCRLFSDNRTYPMN